MTQIENLSNEELQKRLVEWRLEPVTKPLPPNGDIQPARLNEYNALRQELKRRGLMPEG
ncbi:MAG: hypothetical protein WED83_02450 [Acidimicrobiia bacterium]